MLYTLDSTPAADSMPLSSTDFRPLATFPLLWRWTRPEHEILPERILATIEPLTEQAAERLAPEAARRGGPRPVSDYELVMATEWDDRESAHERLLALGIPLNLNVIVHWDDRTAVRCPWRTFVDYWNAFCYPSSDDVTIWALDDAWTLSYRHFEAFHFERQSRAV